MNNDETIRFYNSDSLGANLFVFHNNYKKFINDALSKYGINLIQALCLVMIDKSNDINQKGLSDTLFLTKGAITKSVSKLESQELIFREKSKKDKRNYILKTSEKGKDRVSKIFEINKKWEAEMGLNDLPDEFKPIFQNLAKKSIEINSKLG